MTGYFSRLIAFCAFGFALVASQANAGNLKLAVTTSFENSGLADHLLPSFSKQTGIKVHLLVVGTGQALKLASRGDVDILLVHSKKAEQRFIRQGYGLSRHQVMYNDFIIVGPKQDPAKLKTAKTIDQAFGFIAQSKSSFISRGDDSGTHKKELSLWASAGVDLKAQNGKWYKSSGTGMGATLNITAASNSYTLADRATWLKFSNKRELELVFAGDKKLHNQYSIILINPEKHPHINQKDARVFLEWITSSQGQAIIDTYRLMGQKLFIPNAKPSS